jgi:anti-sigma B factor antagonist
MKLSTEDVGQVTVVVLDIDILDAGNAKEFKADMSPILEKSSKVVFDMSSVNFLDSSGCGALLTGQYRGRGYEAVRRDQTGSNVI